MIDIRGRRMIFAALITVFLCSKIESLNDELQGLHKVGLPRQSVCDRICPSDRSTLNVF
jgi:hypothetical protein